MSIQQFKPILFAGEAVSKTPFSKKGKQSLYFITSLTTLLLLQACAGSGNGDLDRCTQGGNQNGGNQNGGDQNGGNPDGSPQGGNQNGDDQNGDSTTPEEVQPPSPSEIIKVLPTEAREDYNGAAYSEVIYNARMSGDFDTQAGNDVLVLWRPGAEGDEASGGRGNDVIESVNSTRAVHGNEGNDVIRSFFNEKSMATMAMMICMAVTEITPFMAIMVMITSMVMMKLIRFLVAWVMISFQAVCS